jgi:hypothetical protein
MKKNLYRVALAAAGAMAALAFSSCAYDPYYTSVGGSYSSGYGDGYGYGGSSFSTSVFVSTGDPNWGYDPYCYSYYDYRRRCYYDPYLNGYYPLGYRPAYVYGVPHPYGWRPGHGYCPPPRNYRNVTVSNYRNREAAYRNSNYSWANQVRQQPTSAGRGQDNRQPSGRYDGYRGNDRPNQASRPNSDVYGRPSSYSRQQQGSPYARPDTNSRSQQGNPYARPDSSSRPQQANPYSRPNTGRPSSGSNGRDSSPPASRTQQGSGRSRQDSNGIPSRYNTPVTASAPSSQARNPGPRTEGSRPQAAQSQQQRGERSQQAESRDSDNGRDRGSR